MSIQRGFMFTCAVAYLLITVGASNIAAADTINDPSYFDSVDSVTIEFEHYPGSGDLIPDESLLTDQYSVYGVWFSSEDVPSALQTTDPADVAGRFETSFQVMAEVALGGSPTSGLRYASGHNFPDGSMYDGADMRIDFDPPVQAFGLYVIDNDFTDVRIVAYDGSGAVLGTVIAPQVDEGGFVYCGISAIDIAYVILDGDQGVELDSTFIDDLTFTDEIMPDCNENGIDDAIDEANCDGSAWCQDCNENDQIDVCDIADGTSGDCNSNGTPDECEIAGGQAEDCNLNGVPDFCDVIFHTSRDCNVNGVPDECEALPECPWDASPGIGDCTVGLGDLNAMLSNWGLCPPPCAWDFAPVGGDGVVGLGDLNALLSNWGPCP